MRRLSEQSLLNAALHYLRRYSASRKGLTQVLERKVKRYQQRTDADVSSAAPLIAKVVERMVSAGYIDDVRFAEGLTASWLRQGKSTRLIRLKLIQKGVEPELAQSAVAASPETELEAARTLVRKRKLGVDPSRRQRDLACLMRAGFRFETAKCALSGVATSTATPVVARSGASRSLAHRGSDGRDTSDD